MPRSEEHDVASAQARTGVDSDAYSCSHDRMRSSSVQRCGFSALLHPSSQATAAASSPCPSRTRSSRPAALPLGRARLDPTPGRSPRPPRGATATTTPSPAACPFVRSPLLGLERRCNHRYGDRSRLARRAALTSASRKRRRSWPRWCSWPASGRGTRPSPSPTYSAGEGLPRVCDLFVHLRFDLLVDDLVQVRPHRLFRFGEYRTKTYSGHEIGGHEPRDGEGDENRRSVSLASGVIRTKSGGDGVDNSSGSV
jgi:hypothetical protein